MSRSYVLLIVLIFGLAGCVRSKGPSEYEKEIARQKEILVEFYNKAGGDSWKNNENWNSDKDLSEWYGVKMSGGKVTGIELSENSLTGELTKRIAELTDLEVLDLSFNELSGSIPASIGSLKKIRKLVLGGNYFSGTIPSEITSASWWQSCGWLCLDQHNGLSFTSLNLEIPEFVYVASDGTSVNSNSVSNAKVTVYYFWTTYDGYSDSFHESMSGWYSDYKDKGLQVVGVCLDGKTEPEKALSAVNKYGMDWPMISEYIYELPVLYVPTVMAFDNEGKLIFHSAIYERKTLGTFLKTRLDGDFYVSSDFSADGKYHVLNTATLGRGIDIVLMGDAFSDRQIADGSYGELMKKAADLFFSIEPYSSFRQYFNVYYIDAVSKNEGIVAGGETALSTTFGAGTQVGGNDEKCMEYASGIPSLASDDSRMNEILIIVIINSENYAGTCYMSVPTNLKGDYGRGSGIAYLPKGTSDEVMGQLIHHEAGGHGFSKLMDEYFTVGTIPQSKIDEYRGFYSDYGWGRNVDFTSDPAEVIWSKFIVDARYLSEKIGVYEGSCTYVYGAYRPTDYSIMRNNTGGFNAPSREAIYNRICKLAFGSSWTFDYEDFVAWDEINRTKSAVSWSGKSAVPAEEMPAPPVLLNRSWKNGRFEY